MPIKQKIFDKYFKEEKRAAQRKAYVSGYGDAGASLTKRAFKGFIAESISPNRDINDNNKTMRQRARMLYMASPVATSAVNTNRTKAVGGGLHMRSAVDRSVLGLTETAAEEWQKAVEAEFEMWADRRQNCDALGLNNFYELQQIAIKSWLTSGDIFALFQREDKTPMNPYSLRIQLIEADRVSTPMMARGSLAFYAITDGLSETGNKIYDGVEVNSKGKVVAYHICSDYPQHIINSAASWTRVEAVGANTGLPNIIQVMDAERPDQYRGVSYLAPTIEMLLQMRRYTESELTAALVQSYLTAWITQEADDIDGGPFNEIGSESDPNSDGISDFENDYEMGPGTINYLRPGESVTLGNPNMPSSGFESFVKTISRMIGAGLGLPYDVLIKEFNSSYSAAKGALEEAWEEIKVKRSCFINDFCQPIYETWLAEAVALGRINAPGFFSDPRIRAAWCNARWDGPAQTHLDPTKEAQANEMAVRNGWKTNTQVTREAYGGDWAENMEALNAEKAKIGTEPTQTLK